MFVLGLFLAGVSLAGPAPTKNSAADTMEISLKKQRESLQKQRDSIRRQPGLKRKIPAVSTDFIEPISWILEANCPRLPTDEIESLIDSAAQQQSLQPALIRAVMRQESGFRPCAVSLKGAQGLMQLMPETAWQFGVSDPFDPKQNVDAGSALLRQLLDRYNGDLRLALAAYNAGSKRVEDPAPQPYPAETEHYIANIFAELGISPPETDPMQPAIEQPPVSLVSTPDH